MMRKLSAGLMLVIGILVCAAGAGAQSDVIDTLPFVVLNGHRAGVNRLAWSPDGQILASAAGNFDSTDNSIRLWSREGELLATLRGHSHPVDSLDWSPDGQTLASGSFDKSIRLWDREGRLLRTITTDQGEVYTVDWSPDGQKLASASLVGPSQNTIQIWDAEGTLLHTLPTQYSGGKFLNVGWSPDGQYLAGGAIDYSEWQADGTLVFQHESCAHCTPAWGFGWSPDSSMWAIGNESGLMWVYDVAGNEVAELTNSVGNVDLLQWSPDGQILAGANSLWDVAEGGFKLRTIVDLQRRLLSLAWSPDSRFVGTSATLRNVVRLWDTEGHHLGDLSGHEDVIEALAWSPDGALLASGSDDLTIRLWDVSGLGT